MKKDIFLPAFFLLLILGACSTDDDTVPLDGNRILGSWILQTYLYDGEEYIPEECETQLNVDFLSNGTAVFTAFYEVTGEEECVSYTYKEDWEYMGNDTYKFTEEDGEAYTVQITFSNNNSICTITSEDEDGTYRAVYIKDLF